ncbi:MAG: nitrate reductase associated protein [Prochlorococcaceae cyanobacterium]
MSVNCACFDFEADFTADLRCIPMAVRRKLDLAGIKLKLSHWTELSPGERQQLLAWSDTAAALSDLHAHLLNRTSQLQAGVANTLPLPQQEPWQQGQQWPEVVLSSCRQLGLNPDPQAWGRLSELQRFALVKLSHPGHEHRNLPRALAEFDVLQPGK